MGHSVDTERRRRILVAQIANGQTLSNAITLDGLVIFGFVMPAAWTAADITFDGSADGVVFSPVFADDGTEVKITAANVATTVGKMVVNATVLERLAACQAIKIRSGVSGATVAQGAARNFTLIGKG